VTERDLPFGFLNTTVMRRTPIPSKAAPTPLLAPVRLRETTLPTASNMLKSVGIVSPVSMGQTVVRGKAAGAKTIEWP